MFISSRRAKGGRNPQVVNELADCRQANFFKNLPVPVTVNKRMAFQPLGILAAPIWRGDGAHVVEAAAEVLVQRRQR